ncbi:hypothetical protein KSS87_005924, partial [Heliosperma pusillum]
RIYPFLFDTPFLFPSSPSPTHFLFNSSTTPPWRHHHLPLNPTIYSLTQDKGVMEKAKLNGSSSPGILTQDELKKIAAYKAVEFVESGMVIGLGTGSTAKHAVARIGELLRLGKLKNIIGIPTSKMTHELAVSCGIPLSDLSTYPVVDLAIDGADEVDPYMNLVKGRGGSLLRE